jgi:hypothetical protein
MALRIRHGGAAALIGATVLSVACAIAGTAQALPLPTLPKGWFVTAEALYGWRSVSSDGELIIYPFGSPTTSVYSGGDIHLPGALGADLRVGYDTKAWGVEARYFGGFHWKKGKDLGPPPDFVIGVAAVSSPTGLATGLDSRLHTAELNLRRPINPSLMAFAGIRGLSFDDRFTADVAFAASSDRYTFDAATTAIGLQVGAAGRFSLLTDNVGFELLYASLDGRGGVLFEKNVQSYSRAIGGGGGPTGGSTANGASGFIELGVSIGRRIGPYSLEGGYRLFYVDRIPTGEGYAANATATANTNNPPAYKSLLVQAITLGIKGKF